VHLHAIARPNAPALLVWSTIERERRTISYCELAAHVSAARQHVRHLVLQCPGRTTCAKERIAILSHNSAAYLVHSLACMSLCSISVHLNWRMAPPTLGEQLVGLDCALLLVSTTLEANGRQAATDAPACRVEVFGALGPPLAASLDAQERQRAEVEACLRSLHSLRWYRQCSWQLWQGLQRLMCACWFVSRVFSTATHALWIRPRAGSCWRFVQRSSRAVLMRSGGGHTALFHWSELQV
jgi:acyl-CoA synthetase (AMP-forming)/AMP-acid ligase II